MSMLLVIKCDVCRLEQKEKEHGAGFPGWGQLMGIKLNGIDNPNLCPSHLAHVADVADKLTELNKR